MGKVKSLNTKNLTLQQKLKNQKIASMLSLSNLGIGINKTFENFEVIKENKYAYKRAKNWIDYIIEIDSDKGIIFYGPTGVGKTHLLCAMANSLIRGCEIFTYFLKTVNIPREDNQAIQELIKPHEILVLCLDDIGTEKMTERALECLFTIIDGRLNNCIPLLATTNYNQEQLKVRLNESGFEYGDRIVGRLQEACEWVPVGGSDYRDKL